MTSLASGFTHGTESGLCRVLRRLRCRRSGLSGRFGTLLTLTLGHSVAASSTVLAAFMGGLALGAWAAGRFPLRGSRSLSVYASLELLVAGIAVVLPSLFSVFEPLLAGAYADGTAPVRFAIARTVVSLVLIGLPAAAMGATFPVAVSWLARLEGASGRGERLRGAIEGGVLYTVNTAGAAAGAIAAGFWLIPSLGIRSTTWIAVALNIASACGALWLARTQSPAGQSPVSAQRGRRRAPPQQARDTPRPVLASAAAGVSGFAALVYEVTWTQLIVLIVGPTSYAFAIMAASFICGIAIGSVSVSRWCGAAPGWRRG